MTPEQKLKKLQKALLITETAKKEHGLAKIVLDIEEKIDTTSKELETKIEEVKKMEGPQGFSGAKGDKGDKGDKGERGIQGIRGDKGEKGDKGDSGKDGKDGLDGANGLNGKDGIDGSPDTAEDIRNKLEVLNGKDRLAFGAIRESEDILKDIEDLKVRPAIVERIVEGGGGSGLERVNSKQGVYQIDFGTGLEVTNTVNGVRVNALATTSTDEKVKYDDSDPAAGYLADKIVAGTGITLSEGTGADENKLQITNTLDLSGYLTLDQTTPQTTVGTFTFPDVEVTNDINVGGSGTFGGNQSGQSIIQRGMVINESGGGLAGDDFRAETLNYANAFLVDASADTITMGVLGASTGLVKSTAGVLSLDTSTYLTDAPSDTKYYGRKDGAWAEVSVDLSAYLKKDGSVPLTADWNMGAFDITGGVDATFSGTGSFLKGRINTTVDVEDFSVTDYIHMGRTNYSTGSGAGIWMGRSSGLTASNANLLVDSVGDVTFQAPTGKNAYIKINGGSIAKFGSTLVTTYTGIAVFGTSSVEPLLLYPYNSYDQVFSVSVQASADSSTSWSYEDVTLPASTTGKFTHLKWMKIKNISTGEVGWVPIYYRTPDASSS